MSHFEKKVQLNKIIESQLPEFLVADFPKAVEFFKQYYISQEAQGGNIDLVDNLDRYIKLDNLIPEVVVGTASLSADIDASSTTITVSSTKGYPDDYGLLKIDDEIITYTSKTDTSFIGCVRGFSGVTGFDDTTKTYFANTNRQSVIFEDTIATSHSANATIQNLSALFLQEFYKKLKKTFTPGFEEETFVSDLNVSNFIKHARNFYQSKGIEESVIILFKVLYGVTAKVIDLEGRLIKPSSADYIRREVAVAQVISGDPFGLEGQTIFKSTDLETNASVSEVEIFTRENETFYKLGLFIGYNDRDLVEGSFTIPGYSKVLETVNPGDSVISVDSTIGFDESGTIISGNNTITYTSKSVNQFFGCSGVTNIIDVTNSVRSNETVFGYENGDATKKCELRITGVLSDFEALEDISLVEVGERISVKNVGEVIQNPAQNKTNKEIFANSWIYNTRTRFEVESISGNSLFSLYSEVDKSTLRVGDSVEILIGKSEQVAPGGSNAIVQSITQSNVVLGNIGSFVPVLNQSYSIRRKLVKGNSLVTPIKEGNNVYIANTLNVYTDDTEEFGYIASNSLPGYQITDQIVESSIPDGQESNLDGYSDELKTWKSIKFSSSVRFLSGDRVKYTAENQLVGLVSGDYYYVKVIKSNEIELYLSKSSLYLSIGKPVRFIPNQLGGTHTFTLDRHENKELSSNNILRKIPLKQLTTSKEDVRNIGNVGVLIDGVEITSPDSRDAIYFGPLEKFEILNGGKDYDVINPPEIKIASGVSTALVEPVIVGSVKQVFVDPQDFDVDDVVSVSLTGGNGSGCVLDPIFGSRFREVSFDSRSLGLGGGVDITDETITFIKDHNFITGQPIIYNNNGNDSISIGNAGDPTNTITGTLGSGDQYFARYVNPSTIKVHNTESDALAGINTIGFSTATTSAGVHHFRTLPKNNLRQIKVLSPGSGYTHRKLRVKTSGISTTYNTISFKNHGFETGETVNYSTTGNVIGGLNTSNQYKIQKIDSDTFRVIDIGVGGTITTDSVRDKYTNLTDVGSGYHVFQYPPIEITANISYEGGVTGTFTFTPLVTGEIVDAYLYETGTGYGTTTLNLHKKPTINVSEGKNAQFLPIILNGKVVDVQVLNGGTGYKSTPELVIEDTVGTGAIIRPVMTNGKITDVVVINEGIGYNENTAIIKVKSRGFGAKFDTRVRKLHVNDAERFSKFSKNQSEKIFSNLYKNEEEDSLIYGIFGYSEDLAQNLESLDGFHSPIIGWAYDGNPIYGPYAYSDPKNISDIKIIKPSYELSSSLVEDRPDFEDGFFTEDYRYTGSGDLDKHNGRFGKTPEYPNGVYAYFVGVTTDITSSTPAAFEPQYPYFIGNTYQSEFIEDNLVLDHKFDFNNSNLVRNTLPYNVARLREDYDFINESYEQSDQFNFIKSVSQGDIDQINVISGGSGYKIGDSVNFDDTDTNGVGLRAQVSELVGVAITSLDTTLDNYENVVFEWDNDREVSVYNILGFDIFDTDTVVVSGLSTSVDALASSFTVGFSTESVSLAKTMTGYSGVVAEEGKYEDIFTSRDFSNVSIGNSIRIVSDEGTEIVKVLNDFNNGILRVQRSGSIGTSHNAGGKLELLNDRIVLPVKTKQFDSKRNEIVFFNALQSVGVGTTPGGAVEKTFLVGDTNVTVNIPTRQIRIPNHPFKTGQKVKFEKNPFSGVDEIIAADNSGDTGYFIPSDVSEFYIIDKGKDYIGLTSQKDLATSGDGLFFLSAQENNSEYKLSSIFPQVTGDLSKINTKISCGTTHGLQAGDTINLTAKPNTIVGLGTTAACTAAFDVDNQLLLINRVGINSTEFNIINDTITSPNHGYRTGDKLLYTSDEVAEGLVSGQSYYVIKDTSNTFKLAETLYETNSSTEKHINLTGIGDSSHKFALINPQIDVVKNNSLQIKLEDPSLTGYELKIYKENDFINEYNSSSDNLNFNVVGVGTAGLSGASVTIKYSENVPSKLFYSLEKGGYISTADRDVVNFSEINYIDSEYSGTYKVSDTANTTFNISPLKLPKVLNYTSNQFDSLKYTVKSSTNIAGPIAKVNIISKGFKYEKLPKLKDITTLNGINANVETVSSSIGRINKTRFSNIGYDYPSDKTLRPQANIPPVIKIDNLDTITEFNIISGGNKYITAPDILLWNDTTNEIVDSTSLVADAPNGSISEINQIAPIFGLQSEPHRIISINNSNGVGISSITTSSSGIATCILETPIFGFITPPFAQDDLIFVEGTELVTDGDGYNSENYNYKFFKVISYTNTDPAELEFKLASEDSVGLTTNPGIAKTAASGYATIINKKNYPDIKVLQDRSSFALNEELLVDVGGGFVKTDLTISLVRSDYIKVEGRFGLENGYKIKGVISGCIADVTKVDTKRAKFNINYSSKLDIGWKNDIGKISEDYQVIPDNDYYQNLSYSVKSPITWDEFSSPVNSIIHPAGLKNFADVGISSTADTKTGIGGSATAITILDVVSEKRVDTINTFDNAVDDNPQQNNINDFLQSNSLEIQNRNLTDFTKCKTNRVLIHDDVSDKFSSSGFKDIFKEIEEIDTLDNHVRYLIQIIDPDSGNIQITELVLQSTLLNTYLFTKYNSFSKKLLGTFRANVDSFGRKTLIFDPVDPYDTDHDIKVLKKTYLYQDLPTGITGTGTEDLGSINLTSTFTPGIGTVGTATSTKTLVEFNVNDFNGAFASVEIRDRIGIDVNYIEAYINFDGINTPQISEYYFDSENISYSSVQTGILDAVYDSNSGIVSLTATNNEFDNTDVYDVRSTVVGFGTTTSGIGTYRFLVSGQPEGSEKSVRLESKFGEGTGPIRLGTFDINEVASSNSIVRVSAGQSSAIHQVTVVANDIAGETYVTPGPFSGINTTSGIGTFGSQINGSDFYLNFYPDPGYNVKGQSFNEVLYRFSDFDNEPLPLEFGPSEQNVFLTAFDGLNGERANRVRFKLTHENNPIYTKEFNPADTTKLNYETGVFTFPNHFFNTGEELFYIPKSTFAGVGQTAVGIGTTENYLGIATDKLPERVYPIALTPDSFQLATKKEYAKAGIFVTFTDAGEGNAHELEFSKKLSKTVIALDGIVQQPITFTPINHNLDFNNGAISAGIATFNLSGISSIQPRDLLRIDDEYMKVIEVGLSTNFNGEILGPINGIIAAGSAATHPTVSVKRGIVGSAATTHSDGTNVQIYRGSFNIVKNEVFFVDAPKGNTRARRDESNLPYVKAEFSGRTFLRSNYDSNMIFDDISDEFTGIGKTFALTVGGANTSGIEPSNGILFINGVFQTPTTNNNSGNNYEIESDGTAGITTVVFTGITSENGSKVQSVFDINQNQVPRGGLIVSLGSTPGLGYAPLFGAKVKAKKNSSGALTEIVGIDTYTNPVSISTAFYNKFSGVLNIETVDSHNLKDGDRVQLVGLHFTCTPAYTGVTTTIFPDHDRSFDITNIISATKLNVNVGPSSITHHYVGFGSVYEHFSLNNGSGYRGPVSIAVTDLAYEHRFERALTNAITANTGTQFTPTAAKYTSHTGALQLTIPNHGLTVSNTVTITDDSLFFRCSDDNFFTEQPYPRSTDPASGSTLAINSVTSSTITVNVGPGGGAGTGATVEATVGAGGTLAFNITNPGSGYVNPFIQIPEPNYENMPIVGVSRLGIGATTDTGENLLMNLTVGAAATVGVGASLSLIDSFKIVRSGYSFRPGDVFEVVGLVTAKDYSEPIAPFQLEVVSTFNDFFSAWTFGEMDYIDDIKDYQDGIRKRFPLFYNGELLSFELDPNEPLSSAIDLDAVLMIFINGVLQTPGYAYNFTGGTSFQFTRPPRKNDKVDIFFYLGQEGVDVEIIRVTETIKIGDDLFVQKHPSYQETVDQLDSRIVTRITSSKNVDTPIYTGPGINQNIFKPFSWTKQKKDFYVNGDALYKTRDSLEPRIYPTAKIIGDLDSSSKNIFVDNAQFFMYDNEHYDVNQGSFDFDGFIIDHDNPTSAKLSPVVSAAGSVTSVSILNGGSGYSQGTISVSIASPIGGIGNTIFKQEVANRGGTIGAGSNTITGIITSSITVGQSLASVFDGSLEIIDNTYNVTSISSESNGTVVLNKNAINTEQLTKRFDFGFYQKQVRAEATATVSAAGTVASISVTNTGTGYTNSTPPNAIVGITTLARTEKITKFENVQGFTGIITGINETTDSGGQKSIKFNFTALDHYTFEGELKVAGEITSLVVGYPVVISNTKVGNGVISVNGSDNSVVGIGTSFLDNIYIVKEYTMTNTADGEIICNVISSSNLTGIGSTGNFDDINAGLTTSLGKMSWGRIYGNDVERGSSPISIGVTGLTVDAGLSTFPTIQRRGDFGEDRTGAIRSRSLTNNMNFYLP